MRPLLHHHHAVGQRHRLLLVVGDVEGRDLEPPLQGAELIAHLGAQPGIEVAERLVEQQHLGLEHQGAGDRHALLLAAGQGRRRPVGEALHLDQAQRRRHLCRWISALATWRTLSG